MTIVYESSASSLSAASIPSGCNLTVVNSSVVVIFPLSFSGAVPNTSAVANKVHPLFNTTTSSVGACLVNPSSASGSHTRRRLLQQVVSSTIATKDVTLTLVYHQHYPLSTSSRSYHTA